MQYMLSELVLVTIVVVVTIDCCLQVICIGSKDGGSEKFLAMVSALLAGDLSDAQNLVLFMARPCITRGADQD